MHFLSKTDASLSAHFESWHAVYSDYIPDTIKESPALLSVFLSVEIFGIDNHFSVRQRLLLPESSGSSGTGSLFRSGCFHRTPDAFSESSSKDTASCFPLISYIFLYTGSHCNLHIHISLLLIDSRFCFFVFSQQPLSAFSLHDRCRYQLSRHNLMFSRLLMSFLKLLFFHFS